MVGWRQEGLVAVGGLPHRLVGADATTATTAQWTPPGSQHNRTKMAPCGNGGPSLFRQVQSPPWVKSKPNALYSVIVDAAARLVCCPRPHSSTALLGTVESGGSASWRWAGSLDHLVL